MLASKFGGSWLRFSGERWLLRLLCGTSARIFSSLTNRQNKDPTRCATHQVKRTRGLQKASVSTPK